MKYLSVILIPILSFVISSCVAQKDFENYPIQENGLLATSGEPNTLKIRQSNLAKTASISSVIILQPSSESKYDAPSKYLSSVLRQIGCVKNITIENGSGYKNPNDAIVLKYFFSRYTDFKYGFEIIIYENEEKDVLLDISDTDSIFSSIEKELLNPASNEVIKWYGLNGCN